MRRRTVQPEIRSFVSVLWSPVTPLDRSKRKNGNGFEECNVFGNGKCELSAIQEGRNEDANSWQGKVQNSSPILRCKFLARKSAKLSANFSATKVTSLPSFALSLSLSLCISLSLSHRAHLTHNIRSAFALPIINHFCIESVAVCRGPRGPPLSNARPKKMILMFRTDAIFQLKVDGHLLTCRLSRHLSEVKRSRRVRADRWGMLFSAPKSKHIPIRSEAQQSPSVFKKGVPIPQVRTHKHLGLIFNSTYTWNDHNYFEPLHYLCSDDRNSVDAFMEAFHHRPWKKIIYTAVIRSRIEYACAVWSGGQTQRLQRLHDSFSKRHGIMLPPLQKRFDYHTLVLLYRIREKLAPDHLFSLLPSLISSTSGYSLRKHSYPVPFTKKSATLNSFLPRAIILWNTLPFDVQSS